MDIDNEVNWSKKDLSSDQVFFNCKDFIGSQDYVTAAFEKCRKKQLSYETININGIPVVVKPEPSLLLTQMTDVFDAETSNELTCRLQEHDFVVMYGTSGSGKTRLILEILAQRIGFYFVSHQDLQGKFGSEDMQNMFSKLRVKLSSNKLEANEIYCRRYFQKKIYYILLLLNY